MTLAIFDTHAFIKRLTAAGMPEAQAEVLADEQSRLIGDGTATKADIVAFRADVDNAFAVAKGDVASFRADVDKAFAVAKADVDKAFAVAKVDVDKEFAVAKADVASFRADVDKQFAVVNAELALVKWMVGGIGFGTIALVIRSFLHLAG